MTVVLDWLGTVAAEAVPTTAADAPVTARASARGNRRKTRT
jgi:hypothetical protein